ncbi:MAG TPA: helix-hairpin-helix domain-containing protein [Candidatus Levilactobacillus faecigallinarum]|uniref:Helix-hairpin-helix domain-containing protein n=1 Tax=Candidatus Levilactobacillus faecigallinarum TaxID=2838638 RepID=A0A9D1U551_9LACO|nr:helix-hairpin-helix domain-containing protein [Candidatus Levilactobacillus faecigallinarum]
MQQIWEWWCRLSRRNRVISGGLVVMCVLGMGWFLSRPAPVADALPPAGPPPAQVHSARRGSSQSHAASETRIFVDVQGAVRRPGLYQFAAGKRIADAITAAGGATEKLDRRRVNLATRLVDQQQVYLPRKGERETPSASPVAPAAPGGPVSATSGSGSGQQTAINLNTATVTDLQQLTGIGAKKAQKIVDYRTEHGDFKTVKDLTQVPGFGEKTVENLGSHLTTE